MPRAIEAIGLPGARFLVCCRGAIGGEALGEQSNAAARERPGRYYNQHPSDQAPRRSTERASQQACKPLSLCTAPRKRKRALNVKRQRHGRFVVQAQRWTAKKEPEQSILGASSSLVLLSRRLRGCRGTGVSRRKLLQWASCRPGDGHFHDGTHIFWSFKITCLAEVLSEHCAAYHCCRLFHPISGDQVQTAAFCARWSCARIAGLLHSRRDGISNK